MIVYLEVLKQLPARLTTLKRACLVVLIEANPDGCPYASVIGHAIVHTPVLSNPLAGSAYLVSNGGEAFPSLTMVLKA
jgi:hypothetical protein